MSEAIGHHQMASVRRIEHLDVMRVPILEAQNLIELKGSRVDDQQAPHALRTECPFPGGQVNPLAILRNADAVILEHVFPTPGQHVVALGNDRLAPVGIDDRDSGQRDAAEQAAIARPLGGIEHQRMFLRVPGIRAARIETLLKRHPELGCERRCPSVLRQRRCALATAKDSSL